MGLNNDYALYPNKKTLPMVTLSIVTPTVIPYKANRAVNFSEFQIQES